MERLDYNGVEAKEIGDFKTMPAGGYICQIITAEDVPDKKYLKIEADVAEGEFKDNFSDMMARTGFWGATLYRTYKKEHVGMFLHFQNAVEESNPGFKYDFDERTLVGKFIGIIFREEEYVSKKDGEVKKSIRPYEVCSVQKIRSGDFKVPSIKKMTEKERQEALQKYGIGDPIMDGFSEMAEDDELPF